MQELEQKIEQTIADEQQHEMQFEGQPDVVAEEPLTSEGVVGAIQQGMEQAAVAIDDPQSIEVAGLKDIPIVLGKATQEAMKRTGKAIPDEPVQTIGGRVVIKEATPDDVAAINEALGGQYAKGLNFPRIAEQAGDFNLSTYMAQIKDVNSELFEKARRGTISFETLLENAESRGIDNIIVNFLKRRPGDPATAEEVLGGIIGSYQLIKETDEAFMAARAMPAGAERDQAMVRAKQMLAAQGTLLANVSGAASEAGRTMFVAREAGKRLGVDIGERAEKIQFLFGAESAEDIEHIGDLYMLLDSPRAKAKFAEQGSRTSSMDMVTEVWINAILSNPVTHAVNVAGNASFMLLRTLETGLASGIGAARSAITGNKNRVRAREMVAQFEGMRRGLADAVLLSGRVLMTEEPLDMASKIDVRNTRAIGTTGDFRDVVDMVRSGNMAAGAVNAYGIAMRMPGRFLMAEDEFFKAIAYRMTVHQEAIMQSGDYYDELMASGKYTTEQAQAKAAALEASILDDPPLDIMKSAKQAAQQMTFQGDLEGFLGQAQAVASHPLAKLFMPFFKTPTNVIKETLSRSPLAIPSAIKTAIQTGGREADMAMAKVFLGSSMMTGFAYISMGIDDPKENLIITGKGPSKYEAQQAMSRQGFQPYSINFKIYDDDGNWTGKYQSYTYSRFDPISGMLAMAADFAYYAQYEDDASVLEALAMSATMSTTNYVTQMPFLQGLQEISSVFRQPENLTEKAASLLVQKLAEAGLTLVPVGTSSFAAGVERVQDPTVRSTLPPEEGIFGEDVADMPPPYRAFYTALQKAKARNPFFSDSVEPKLNLWGEVMTTGSGTYWDMVNPIRVQSTKYSAVDQELMELGGGIPMPPKKIDGVVLNAVQYNKVLTYMNTMDAYGKMPGDDGYDKSLTLLPLMENELTEGRYADLPTKEQKIQRLRSMVNEAKSAAIKKLRLEDSDLDIKILAVQ